MFRFKLVSIGIVVSTVGFTALWIGWPEVVADPPETAVAVVAPESLDVQYARAHLELATLDLQRALDVNGQTPNLLSERTVQHLRKRVAIDRKRLEQNREDSQISVHEIYVRSAEATLEIAEEELARNEAVFRKSPDSRSDFDLRRAKAVTKVARLNLERMKTEAGPAHTLSYLQWQLEELRNRTVELEIRLEQSLR